MEILTTRAVTAYYRSLRGEKADIPLEAQHTEFEGRGYIVLRHRHDAEVLAVYRCMNRGELKRLKRWPVEVVTPTPPEPAATPSPVIAEPPSMPTPTPTPTPASHLLLDLIPLPRKAVSNPPEEPGAEQADLF